MECREVCIARLDLWGTCWVSDKSGWHVLLYICPVLNDCQAKEAWQEAKVVTI